MVELVKYDAARRALAEASTIDEAREIRDKAEALKVYAQQRGDIEMETWVADIKVRAIRRIGELSGKLDLAPLVPGEGNRRLPSSGKPGKAAVLAAAGLSTSVAHRCEQLATIPEQDFESFIEEKRKNRIPITFKDVLKHFKKLFEKASKTTQWSGGRKGGRRVATLEELIAAGEKFGCIYSDPPWLYDNQGTRAATGNHYSGLTIDQLCELPVRELAEDDAQLHLWTTNGFLFECPRIFNAWGFEFRSSFVWVKPQMGIGNYWRNSHEILLTAIRGNAKRFNDKTLKSWIECRRGKHSAKPEQVRSFVERASNGPYLEMFGRQIHPRWTVWGLQVEETLFDAANDMEEEAA